MMMYLRDSEKRLIEAVSNIIEREGFTKIGINRIAREAGCDKVLIYRYFGGLEGLLSAWAKENDFYTTAYESFYKEIEEANKDQLQELTKKVLISQLRFLRENVMMQELIVWELTGKSKFKALQEIREKNGHKLQQAFNDKLGAKDEDVSLYITVLVASIEAIVLKTREYTFFNGVDFRDNTSWEKLETVISNYINMIFENLDI